MKSKNVSRIKFGLSRIAALLAAAMLTLGFASCSSDSSDGGTPFLPVNPVPTDQTQTQESEAQKEAAGSYTIGGTTYTVEKGKVTVTNSDGTKTEVGSVGSDGTIKITQNGTTTEIASATAADGTKTTTVRVETKNADGTTTTKTYTGDLSKGTLTNNDDPGDTVTVAKTETPKTDGTTNPTDSTKPADSTNPTDTTNPTDSTTNPTGTNTNPTDPTNPSGTTTPEQQPSSGSGENQPASGSGEQPEVTKYTVTFDLDGVKTTQSVESGNKATEPEKPSKTGCTFEGWFDGTAKFDFNTAITGEKTLTAKWSPATNTVYKVLHYQQNAENDEYTLSDTENLTGTTGEQTAAEAKTYAHFTAGTVTQAAIAADGSTEVRIYYKRETVTFTIDLAGGTLGEQTGTVTKTGKYGQSISVADPTRSGYTFSGWSTTGGKIPATFETSATYTALWTSASGITVTIAPASTISVVKSISDEAITLTADSGFIGYAWLIDGTAASGMTGATVSGDGTRLTLAKENLKENAVYQVSLSATKDGIPYSAQISVKKEPARN